MATFVFVIHVISCLFLVSLILVQKGQGSEIGAAFGGASQTVFGSRGPATFLNKMTIIIAVIFLTASLYLANAARNKEVTSVIDQAQQIQLDEKKAEPAQGESVTPTPAQEEKAPAPAEGTK